jgi:hypothetical protein
MFSFTEKEYTPIHVNISADEALSKYPDKYILTTNGHVENERIHGDVLAVFTAEEYRALVRPSDFSARFSVWVGRTVRNGEDYYYGHRV